MAQAMIKMKQTARKSTAKRQDQIKMLRSNLPSTYDESGSSSSESIPSQNQERMDPKKEESKKSSSNQKDPIKSIKTGSIIKSKKKMKESKLIQKEIISKSNVIKNDEIRVLKHKN